MERIARARPLTGFADEQDCITVSRYAIDRDEWTEVHTMVPN